MLNNKFVVSKSNESQTTIAKSATINGVSPYSGRNCSLTFKPTKTNTGIVFEVGGKNIPATYKFVKYSESNHTTTLKKGGVEIRTVEHLLSAIYGLGIDNISIKLSNSFIPMKTACAQEFADVLIKTGIKKLKAKRKYLCVNSVLHFNEKEDDRYAVFKPANCLKINSTTSFNNIIGTKKVNFQWTPKCYMEEVSWARSFLRTPLDKNLEIWSDVRKTFKFLPKDPKESPIIVFSNEYFYTPLKTVDEPARHKILDFMGDIALLGIRIKSEIELFKPGHRFTRDIVRSLSKQLEQ